MNELFISTPLLSTFDFFAATFFILMAIYLVFHFYIAKYTGIKCRGEIKILSYGYFLTALIILFKAIVLNNDTNTMLDKPTPFILTFSIQLFLTSLIFIYQKITSKSIVKPTLLAFILLFIANIGILRLCDSGFFLNALNMSFFTSVMVLSISSILIVLNILFFKKVNKVLFVHKVSDSELRNNIFMFIIASILFAGTLILFLAGAVRIYYYMVFAIFIIISVIHSISSIVSFQATYSGDYSAGSDIGVNLSDHVSGYTVQSINNGSFNFEHNKIEELRFRLIKLFDEKKPYLKSSLTINDVSQSLYTNKTYLSRVINESMNKNFNQLLNYYRVEEAKRLFYSNNDITMDDLCVKSGFGSMASFSIAFRIYAGTSPSDWCKDQRSKIKKSEGTLNN